MISSTIAPTIRGRSGSTLGPSGEAARRCGLSVPRVVAVPGRAAPAGPRQGPSGQTSATPTRPRAAAWRPRTWGSNQTAARGDRAPPCRRQQDRDHDQAAGRSLRRIDIRRQPPGSDPQQRQSTHPPVLPAMCLAGATPPRAEGHSVAPATNPHVLSRSTAPICREGRGSRACREALRDARYCPPCAHRGASGGPTARTRTGAAARPARGSRHGPVVPRQP